MGCLVNCAIHLQMATSRTCRAYIAAQIFLAKTQSSAKIHFPFSELGGLTRLNEPSCWMARNEHTSSLALSHCHLYSRLGLRYNCAYESPERVYELLQVFHNFPATCTTIPCHWLVCIAHCKYVSWVCCVAELKKIKRHQKTRKYCTSLYTVQVDFASFISGPEQPL